MATNIEQIFRSFVVSKFREIQEQQFGGGKIGSQYNGEINSPEHISSSDDAVGSLGNLQNDPLVQKIEQVLSEVLGAESQYKPDGGEDLVRNKLHSAKRRLTEEVQDEIPKKKSKKDKKHKEKKKKKKRKKEKKHKKQSKESKLNDQQKECEDLQPVLHSKTNPCFTLSTVDDVNIESVPVLRDACVLVQEKTSFENQNLAVLHSYSSSSDSSKMDISEEDSTLVSIEELSEVNLASKRELENDIYKPTSLTMNLCIEDQSLRTAEGGALSAVRSGDFCMEQSEVSSTLEATEKLNVPESSPHSSAVQLDILETSMESEVRRLDFVTDLLNPEGMKQVGSTSLETPALPHLEPSGEAKDSVTTLGFLAMVVGKDFEATSEFLNTAKVKACERSPKHTPLTDMRDDLVLDSERLTKMQDLQKAQQSRTEMKDPEASPKSLHEASEKDFEPALVAKLKPAATSDADIVERELRETQDSKKYQKHFQVEKDANNVRDTPELNIMNKTALATPLSNIGTEAFEEIDTNCLKAKSVTEMENSNIAPFRIIGLKNIDPSPESEEAMKANSFLETFLKAAVEEKQGSAVAEDCEPRTEVKIPESISQSEASLTISGLETAPGIREIAKPQHLEVSEYISANKTAETVMEMKVVNKASESSVTLKKAESTSESQYVKEISNMNDVLQSGAMSHGKEFQSNLETEGKISGKDMDSTSESLHMIFKNYSEQNLELHTEPKVTMKLKSSEIVPQSSHMMDGNNLESQHIRKVKDLKIVESEMLVGLNDLQKKMDCLHRNVKIVEAALECKADSHWPALEEKASDTTEHMKKDQCDAGASNLQSSPRHEDVNSTSKITEGELASENENLLLSSKSSKEMESSEIVPELEALAVVQNLKENVGFTTRDKEHSPKETLGLKNFMSTDLTNSSKSVNILKCFGSLSASQREQNLHSLEDIKAKEVNLGSLYDLGVEYRKRSPEHQFTDKLSNQEEKQKFEVRAEMTGLTVSSKSLYGSERDLIQVPESEKSNEAIGSESVCLAEPNLENVPKSFSMIQMKHSEKTSESKISDLKHLDVDLGSTFATDVEMGQNLPKCVTLVVSETEAILETPKNNELLESQGISALQESESVLGSKASTLINLEAHTETEHENENLEEVPRYREFEVVKKPGYSSLLFTQNIVDIKIPFFDHEAEDNELKVAEAAKIIVSVAKSKGSEESLDVVKETFEPTCMTYVKDLEASQKLETTSEKTKMNYVCTELPQNIDANGTETFKRPESTVGTHISESLLIATDKVEEKGSGTDVEQDAGQVVKYSESVSDFVIVSEKKDGDEVNSSILDTAERNTSNTTFQLKTISRPQSMNLDERVESLSKIETKDAGQVVNYERVSEVKDSSFPVTTATQLITPQLKSSEPVSMSEETDCAGSVNLKPTPVFLGTPAFKSSVTVAETKVLERSDSEIDLGSENNSEVKYFESTSETENILQKTAAVPERKLDKISESVSGEVCPGKMKDLEAILEPKCVQQQENLESSLQSMYTIKATDLEVLDVYETNKQFSAAVEAADLGGAVLSVIVEEVKESEKQLQLETSFEGKSSQTILDVVSMHVSDLQDVDEERTSLAGGKCPKLAAQVASVTDVKNSMSCSELAPETKDTQSGSVLESVHTMESNKFEAASKCESFQEVKDLQVTQMSRVKEVVLESEDLERNSTSVLLPEGKSASESLDSIHVVHVKDSVLTPEYMSVNNTEVSEENMTCVCRAETKDLESTAEHATEARNSEIISQVPIEVEHAESAVEPLNLEKDPSGTPKITMEEQGLKETTKPAYPIAEETLEVQQITMALKDSESVLESVNLAEKDLKAGEQVTVEAKDLETTLKSMHVTEEKDLETIVRDSLNDKVSEVATEASDLVKEREESLIKDKKGEKTSKIKDKSKSSKKAKKSRSKSPSKSKKRKKKSRSHSTTRQVASRRERSRSKHESHSRKKHSTSHHKSRSRSADKKEDKESSKPRRRRSRSKSRSKSVERRDTSTRSRRRRSRSSDHRKSRSRSIDKRESSRRRRLSRSSDKHKSRSRSVERRETLIRSRRRRSRSSDIRKSRSRSADKRETSVRTRRRRSQSSDRYRSRSKSRDRRESSVRTRRRRSRSSDRHKSRSRSIDDKRELSLRTRQRRSRSPDTRKSRSRSIERRETSVRTRRRRSRSSDHRKSRSRSVDKRETLRTKRRQSRSLDNRRSRSRSIDKRETSVRTRRRRSRSSDNRRSKSKSVDKRDSSRRRRRRRSLSSERKSRSKSVEKRESSVQVKRKRSRSSDTHKSRSKSVDNTEVSSRSKRRRSKSADHKSRTKSVEKRESPLRTRSRKSKSLDCHVSKSKSRSKSVERRKDKDSSDTSRGKHSRHRSKSKSIEKTEETESLDVSVHNQEKSPEQLKSKSRSRSKSIDKTQEKENLRRSRSKGSKSPGPRSRRHRTVSRSRRNRSRSLTRRRASRSKSDHRSRTRSQSRSLSRSRRWRRTRSRSLSRQRSLSRERRRRSRRNRSRSLDRRRRRSDSRDSYRVSIRLRSRSRTPVRLRCSRSSGRRRSPSKSPDHRRSRSSSRSPKRLTDLDKAQLLEIAKANAAVMCAKAGVPLPPSLMPVITPEKKEEKVTTQKSAKETIMELTEKCKKIAQSQEDDVIVNKPHVSDEEEEEHPFINHPFKLNEPKPIFFNLTTPTIKPPASKNQVSLTKEFPVSSGSQHRKKEADSAYGEWVPVEKDKDEKKDDVFPSPASLEPVDITSALNERTIAQKRLTENTFDLEAMCLLNRAQERIDAWAELNSIPGHFTGSTGVQVLTTEQLSNSGPQAWVKKDQFLRAAPVTGGMGAQLMRKMGWREGEGLGKNKEGNREPILVDFKTDRKGLVAIGEKAQKRFGPFGAMKDLSGKHPVSALLEVCNKRRWSPPVFVLVNDNRPEYNKHFVFKVMVNGVEHKPTFVSPNKKEAKAMAATVALQALGLLPKRLLANATSFRSASHN